MNGFPAGLDPRDLPLLLQAFVLALGRVGAMVGASPAFSEHGIPVSWRVGASALVSFLLLPAVGRSLPRPLGWVDLAVACAGEILVGLLVALMLQMVFEAVSIGMRIVETQAGFTLGTSNMAGSGGHAALGAFHRQVALLLFFTTGAYRVALRGIAGTFHSIPVGTVLLVRDLPVSEVRLAAAAQGMMVSALCLVGPVVGALLLADVGLGLLSRAAPQMNVFSVGFPVKVAVAVLLSGLVLALFAGQFSQDLHRSLARIFATGGGL